MDLDVILVQLCSGYFWRVLSRGFDAELHFGRVWIKIGRVGIFGYLKEVKLSQKYSYKIE